MPNNTALSFSLGGWGGSPAWQAFFLVLLQKAMIQRLPGAVIFLLTPVMQSSSRNSANMLELLQWCFQCQSSEAEFSTSVACENLYVPSLTPCSESIQQHWDTLSLQDKKKRAAVRESALETCVLGNSVLQCVLYSACYWKWICFWLHQNIQCMQKCMQPFLNMVTPCAGFHLF